MADSGGVFVGGAWHEGDKMGYKTHDGVWHEIDKGYYKGFDGVWRECYSSGIPLSTLSVGSYVNVAEKNYGVRRYLLVGHNYENTGRTILLREKIVDYSIWSITIPHTYSESLVHSRLNRGGDLYLAMYGGTLIEPLLQDVPIKCIYRYSNNNVELRTLSTPVFLLASPEISNKAYYPVDGTLLSYFPATPFATPTRVASDESGNSNQWWWTRTLSSSGSSVADVEWDGSMYGRDTDDDRLGIRPATTLPANLLVSSNPAANGGYDILG